MVQLSLVAALAVAIVAVAVVPTLANKTSEKKPRQVIFYKGQKLQCAPAATKRTNDFKISLKNSQIEQVMTLDHDDSSAERFNFTLVDAKKNVNFNQSVVAAGSSELIEHSRMEYRDSTEELFIFNVTARKLNLTKEQLVKMIHLRISRLMLTSRTAPDGLRVDQISKQTLKKCKNKHICQPKFQIRIQNIVQVLQIQHYKERVREIVRLNLNDPDEWRKHYRLHLHIENDVPNAKDRQIIKGFIKTAVRTNFTQNQFRLKKMVVTITLRLRNESLANDAIVKDPIKMTGLKDVYRVSTNAFVELRVIRSYKQVVEISRLYAVQCRLYGKVLNSPIDQLKSLRPIFSEYLRMVTKERARSEKFTKAVLYKKGPSQIEISCSNYRSSARILPRPLPNSYRDNIVYLATVNQIHTSVDAYVDADFFAVSRNEFDGDYVLSIRRANDEPVSREANQVLIKHFYDENRLNSKNIGKEFVYNLSGVKYLLKIINYSETTKKTSPKLLA